ncbi:MAG: DEAD/DEAH box helicase, partial [Blastocatellia bacterium]
MAKPSLSTPANGASAPKAAISQNGAAPAWKEQLARLLRKDALPARKPSQEALLFFSFVRRNHQFVIQPGVVEAFVAPPELWSDRAALGAFLSEHRDDPVIRSHTFALQQYQLDSYRWVNDAPGRRAIVKQALQQSQWSYYNQVQADWEGLADALVFSGSEQELIQKPLEVLPDVARIELEMQRVDEGVRLSLVAVLPDRAIKLNAPGLEIFSESPLWLCEGGRIFQVGVDRYRFHLLRQQAEVVIPSSATDEFFQRSFADVVSSYDLRGENLIGETLTGVTPQPRLYLTEQEQQLRVLLRFAYNGLDCVGAKSAPPYSYTRDVERDVVVKIERQCELEKQWWERLGKDEFGLKCGNLRGRTTPDVFLLRAKTHPYDFLKNSVPKLAEAGVEIFGEADLSLARINRARPTISFNVSSGIDWFDLTAVIHFGELEISLAEIRKALRKRDRFIKLADGSIGEIPPEWLEKYKHLFGLGETKEDGLRLARHHVTLLDQLLADDERVATDKQFEQARAWIKNFDGIRSQTLPEGFQGELRPYQKAGFDWLYFLRESRFGGCLADDMGTGKTIQTLCFLQSLREGYEARDRRKRKKEPRAASLLVVPRSIVTNWEREAQKFAPDLKILNFANAERAADTQEFAGYDVVLTTYGILLREIERLMDYEFDTVILDEAQAIKNPLSESAKAARLLKSRHRLTLTGTPVENNTLELWSQFAFLNPGLLGSADYFREGFAGPIER